MPARPAFATAQLVVTEIFANPRGNEIPGEFIEIYNPNPTPVNLKGLEVLLVNGAGNAVYTTIDLSPGGTLDPMGYLVIGPPNLAV
ncbi:MAG: lamin tail domain-containing protein, partial [Deltaproteobacteria bacterium]|nr:lamin tail domain-containing protein [Deltaproteobacteria bacterium]